MSIISTSEATNFVGATITDELIGDAEALLEGLLSVDSLEENTYDTVGMVKNNRVIVSNFPITEIIKVGGVDYTGEEVTDYHTSQNIITFVDPSTFYSYVTCRRVKIKYKAGYTTGQSATMPRDIKLLVKYLVSGLYNTKENVGTVSCKI